MYSGLACSPLVFNQINIKLYEICKFKKIKNKNEEMKNNMKTII